MSDPRALLDALVRSVAQATAELIHENHNRPGQAWRERLAIAERMVELTRECAEDEPDGNEYAAVLEALGAGSVE